MFKIGLVGYGFMGKMHSQCYKASGKAKIVAVADVDAAKRKDAQAKYGCEVYDSIEKMLASADIDVVDICTPTFLHEPHVMAAAKAGKHILCEKPMSLSVDSCNKMMQAVKRAGVTLMIAQALRFMPEYDTIKKLVESGKYGKVKFATASRFSAPADWTWQEWLFDAKKSGGGILDLHIHDIDFLNYLLGVPRKVTALGVSGKNGAMDTGLTLMEHANGAKSYAQGSIDLSGTYPFNMSLVVNCEKATIKYDMSASPALVVYPAKGKPVVPKMPKPKIGESTEDLGNVSSLGPYLIEIEYFLNCLKAKKQPEIVTASQAKDAVRVCLAATESAKTGKAVKI